MTVRIHIERLVLDGWTLTAAEAAMLRASLETALAERLSSSMQYGVRPVDWLTSDLKQGGAVPRLLIGAPALAGLAARPTSSALAGAIAGALLAGLVPDAPATGAIIGEGKSAAPMEPRP